MIDIHQGEARGWGYMPPEWIEPDLPLWGLIAHLPPPAVTSSGADQLASQLVRGRPSGTGAVSALTFYTPKDDGSQFLAEILQAITKAGFREPSPARQTIQRRLARTPLEVARQLASHYGHDAGSIVYTRTVAILGHIRLAELTGDRGHLEDIERLLAPYASGEKPSLPAQVTTSHLAGHLVFSELARATGNQKYTELARAAADLGFDRQGRPRESMPFHHEMSDSVFMGTPILAETGRLTGERKYFDMAIRHWRFIQQLDQRRDGLYRNSPLTEAAWGRGNGFPALGLALALTAIPQNHPGRAEMLAAYRVHMRALLRHQDPTGMWHQVIDHPESYRELTATAMIAVAMMRGLRHGWLDRPTYEAATGSAWYALKSRIAPNGELVDVCTGTGKQTSLHAYFDRTAILGRDPRGGAMALLVAVERAAWELDRK